MIDTEFLALFVESADGGGYLGDCLVVLIEEGIGSDCSFHDASMGCSPFPPDNCMARFVKSTLFC